VDEDDRLAVRPAPSDGLFRCRSAHAATRACSSVPVIYHARPGSKSGQALSVLAGLARKQCVTSPGAASGILR
jgi:hypothetical protein